MQLHGVFLHEPKSPHCVSGMFLVPDLHRFLSQIDFVENTWKKHDLFGPKTLGHKIAKNGNFFKKSMCFEILRFLSF